MSDRRILEVVVGSTCSLCDVALDHLRLPARLLGLTVRTRSLDTVDDRDTYAARVPVVLDRAGRVLAEGRVGSAAAWTAVLRARLGRLR